MNADRRRLAAAAACALLAFLVPRVARTQAVFEERRMPYDAFDAMPRTTVEVPGARLAVGIAEGALDLSHATLLGWVGRSGQAVATYYGRFPVSSARILLVPGSGRGVSGGQAWGHRGAAIRVVVGREAGIAALDRDWILVHEMVHLALPRMERRHNWLSEGLASYVEPVARAQAGGLPESAVWNEFARNMHRGLPGLGDEGLDRTASWARTYWGGALFCLLADVEIRRRTEGRLGLQHAMRAVIAAGGTHETTWRIDRILSTADAGVGLDVLAGLYAEMGDRPVSPDLAALWRDLGVRTEGAGVVFDDGAPLAFARRAITRRAEP